MDVKIQIISIGRQMVITRDNVNVEIDSVIYYQVSVEMNISVSKCLMRRYRLLTHTVLPCESKNAFSWVFI